MNNGSIGVLIIATLLSFALMTIVFYGLKYWHHVKHPSEEDIKEIIEKDKLCSYFDEENVDYLMNYIALRNVYQAVFDVVDAIYAAEGYMYDFRK